MARAVQVSEVHVANKRAEKSLEDQLANHLKNAEHHLIEAALLFEKEPKLRARHYIERLHRAQETTTSLHMEELVRIRDQKKRRKKS